jgi:hypothetical protein
VYERFCESAQGTGVNAEEDAEKNEADEQGNGSHKRGNVFQI